MKTRIFSTFLTIFMVAALAGCAAAATALPAAPADTDTPVPPSATTTTAPPTATASPLPPTETLTPVPTGTATTIPSPTPLPGTLVLPLDTLGSEIPWLQTDMSVLPALAFVGFNTQKPPFNNLEVRKAFVHAIDRDVIVEMARGYAMPSAVPATTLTPPQTLGRDLYGEIGLLFDPQKARDLLAEAGYSDPASFPKTVFVVSYQGESAPGARNNMALAMAEMWKTHLGVVVEVLTLSRAAYVDRILNNPPDLYWVGWGADYNDPDNFLRELFHSGTVANFGGFSDAEYDLLVDRAQSSRDPAERQVLYIQAETMLCEAQAAVIPLFHYTINHR